MEFNELAPDQKLVVLTALNKQIGKMLDAKEPGSVRDIADHYVMSFLPDGGNTQVRLNGKKIGTFSVIAKEADGLDVYVSDAEAFADWVRDDDAAANAAIEWVLADRRRRDTFARYIVELTGVVPDGIEAYPQHPHVELSTRLTQVNPKTVADALNGELPTAIAGLLKGE